VSVGKAAKAFVWDLPTVALVAISTCRNAICYLVASDLRRSTAVELGFRRLSYVVKLTVVNAGLKMRG